MTEKEKMLAGMVYEAVLDEDLKENRLKCKDLCFAANQLPPSKIKEQSEISVSYTHLDVYKRQALTVVPVCMTKKNSW